MVLLRGCGRLYCNLSVPAESELFSFWISMLFFSCSLVRGDVHGCKKQELESLRSVQKWLLEQNHYDSVLKFGTQNSPLLLVMFSPVSSCVDFSCL